MIVSEDISQIVDSARVILDRMPRVYGECLYISALFVAMINDNTKLDAKLVVGSLVVQDEIIFNHSDIASAISPSGDILRNWGGHAWVSISDTIYDFSIFRAIHSKYKPEVISNILNLFDDTSYLIYDSNELKKIGVVYKQYEELTDSDILMLLQSAERLDLINN